MKNLYILTDFKDSLVATAHFEQDIHAVGAFKEMVNPGIYKITKNGKFVRSIYVGHEAVESCPNCDFEVILNWDVSEHGYVIHCPYCGEKMMLCDECLHSEDNQEGKCDQCNGVCFRCEYKK